VTGPQGSGWSFAAVGKHPAARDYFRLGNRSALSDGFADWVAGGYASFSAAGGKESPSPRSFRFWARGAGPGALACGVLRDSSDAVGRPFPLLILGCGAVEGWEKRWDALPQACEGAWGQMEALANRSLRDLKRFEEDLAWIRPPQPDWERYAEAGRAQEKAFPGDGGETGRILDEAARRAREASAEPTGIATLSPAPGGDFFPVIRA